MNQLLRAELRKLRTTRILWVIVAASQLLVIGGVSGLVLSGSRLRDPDTVSKAMAHTGLISLCVLVLGIYAVAGEYRYQTIVDTYLSQPRRRRVLAAKLVTYPAVGLVIGLGGAVTALITTKIWWVAKDVPLSLGDANLWRTAIGGVVWNAAFAAIGVGIGALVRNLAAAIAAALAWIALVEGIAGQLVGSTAREWLPLAAGQALGRASIGAADQLPQWGAALVLGGYAALIGLAAASITLRRDVT